MPPSTSCVSRYSLCVKLKFHREQKAGTQLLVLSSSNFCPHSGSVWLHLHFRSKKLGLGFSIFFLIWRALLVVKRCIFPQLLWTHLSFLTGRHCKYHRTWTSHTEGTLCFCFQALKGNFSKILKHTGTTQTREDKTPNPQLVLYIHHQ